MHSLSVHAIHFDIPLTLQAIQRSYINDIVYILNPSSRAPSLYVRQIPTTPAVGSTRKEDKPLVASIRAHLARAVMQPEALQSHFR